MKALIMVLAFALMSGIAPVSAAESLMEAYEGQENVVYTQYVSTEPTDEPGENADGEDAYGSNGDITDGTYENNDMLYWYLDDEYGEYDESPFYLLELEPIAGDAQNALVGIMSTGLQINGAGAYTTVATFQAALQDVLDSGDAVVTGKLTGAAEQLFIDIPANRTLTWRASYSGTIDAGVAHLPGHAGSLMHFPGRQTIRPGTADDRMGLGTLIVAEGANIVNDGTGFGIRAAVVTATITAGSITSNGTSFSFQDNGTGNLLTITGGYTYLQRICSHEYYREQS